MEEYLEEYYTIEECTELLTKSKELLTKIKELEANLSVRDQKIKELEDKISYLLRRLTQDSYGIKRSKNLRIK